MRAFDQRKSNNSASSSFFEPKIIQKKLKTGTVGDKYEVEADSVADKVVKNNPSSGGVLQSKEEVQQKPISQTITSVQSKDMKEEKEPVQKKSEKEEEKPVQKKEEEKEPIQKKEKEEDKLQKKEEKEEAVQAKCDSCEKEDKVQKKEQNSENEIQNNDLEGKLNNSKGSGQSLDKKTKTEMESGFGNDFSKVKIHTDSRAVQMSKELGAQAFTNGNNVYFNEGKYNPNSKEGKHLLAHELTHTVQQTGNTNKVQRYAKDDGWRYTPPVAVKRSISEIQAIVGTTPDGTYGTNTKNAVINYQKKIAALGLYKDTIDGKWGKNTESAHISFSQGSEAKTYNCSGLAFKTFTKIGLPETKKILSGMTALAKPTDTCNPREYKFWFWEYTLTNTDTLTGASHSSIDFHIVGGQTDGKGNDPTQVMSKNGGRPLKGPGSAMSWQPPASELTTENNHTEKVVPNSVKTRTNMVLKCFCGKKLP
ncbi:MAG: DUF4157 domain-containing protein [Chryseobacterium sp.]|nr:MAG: DUF4157 domain-containing protein [Chryseobacterium sp.]